jgi:thiamine pyrophosphokinase
MRKNMLAIIIANGELKGPCRPPNPLKGDLVIAANGGSQHCLSLKITPDVLIGDLDSVDPDLVATWEKQGVEVIRHSADKDQTDLELALLLAQERGAEKISVYGAVGGRLDMTFGNLTLLAHPQLRVPIRLICGNEEVYLLQQGESLDVEGSPGDTLSLLPLDPDGAKVSAQGVQYVLERDKLEFGLTRGISNQLTQTKATIRLEAGLLAVVHTRQSSLNGKEVS